MTEPLNEFKVRYEKCCNEPSDINQHLPVLYQLGLEVNHITEMGVRTGVSTSAFLNLAVNHYKTLISIDHIEDKNVTEWFNKAKNLGRSATYLISSTLSIDIEPTDLLFIDTLHTYNQLKAELSLHANKVRRYIVFHDTTTFPELNLAINEFLDSNKDWKIKQVYTHNNGLTVLERTNG